MKNSSHIFRGSNCRKPLAFANMDMLQFMDAELCNSAINLTFSQAHLTTQKPMPRATNGPLVYDPMSGWRTGASLLTILAIVIICCGTEKLKNWIVKMLKYRRIKKELQKQGYKATKKTECSSTVA